MGKTKIEWTDVSWNPVTGCTKVSEGCRNCYAERMAKRLAGRFGYPADEPFRVTLHLDRLKEPLGWRKPRRVFVCSMGDLFHKDVPWEFIRDVFAVIKRTPQHTYQILTKRPHRMESLQPHIWGVLPNVWLGVSVENQEMADERIPHLLETPAAVRFVSCEPLLGKVTQEHYLGIFTDGSYSPHQVLRIGVPPVPNLFTCLARPRNSVLYKKQLDWMIVGGESGPGARPMHPDWARFIRDQCQEAGIPFFFKQWGEWIDAESLIMAGLNPYSSNYCEKVVNGMSFFRVGKKAAGRLLDGRKWGEMLGGENTDHWD